MASDVVETVRRMLKRRPDVRLTLVFGSVARGTARAESDVDLAVDAPGVDRLALARDLSLAVGREVDAVQCYLDIASHVIADEGWRAATTLAGAFERLAEHGVLLQATADALGKAAGLRNVVAHGYAGVNVEFLHHRATAGLSDLDAFTREVAAWNAGRPAS